MNTRSSGTFLLLEERQHAVIEHSGRYRILTLAVPLNWLNHASIRLEEANTHSVKNLHFCETDQPVGNTKEQREGGIVIQPETDR